MMPSTCVRLLPVAAALAGCATGLPERVEIPVPVPCVQHLPERPALATDALAAGATTYDKARAALAERQQLRGYVVELEAVLGACTAPAGAQVLPAPK